MSQVCPGATESSNTVAPNRIFEVLGSGLDYASGVLRVRWSDWERLQTALEAGREAASTAAMMPDTEEPDIVPLLLWEGRGLGILPHGVGSGFGHFRYVIEDRGVQLCIQDGDGFASEGTWNVRFLVKGLGCLLAGNARGIRDAVYSLVDLLGGTVEQEQLSRVDVAVDVAGRRVWEFVEDWQQGRIVTRARSFAQFSGRHFRDVETFSIGKYGKTSAMSVCIYDKSKQVADKADECYESALCRARGWEQVQEGTTRIEFRFQRPLMKRYGIESLEDLQRMSAMCAYGVREWLRFTSETVVDGQQDHARAAEFWLCVQAEMDCCGHWKAVAVQEPKPASGSRLAKQAIGCFTSFLAVTGQMPDSFETWRSVFARFLGDDLEVLYQKVKRKVCDLESSGRLPSYVRDDVAWEFGSVSTPDRIMGLV